MADQKISELTALTGANVADDDAIAIVDTSATETKKIVFSELKNALDTATGFVRITGDTMTGALDVQSTITADGLNVEILDNDAGPVTIQQGGNSYFKIVTTNSSESVQLGNSTTNPDILLGGGNVGIGTSSPSSKLELVGSGFTDSTIRLQRTDSGENNDAGLQFTANAGANSGHGMGGIWFKNSLDSNAYALIRARTDDATGTSGRLDFITSTSSVGNTTAPSMRIDSSGNVGIGTSSINARADISSTSTSQTSLRVKNSGSNPSQLLIGFDGTSANYFDGNTQIFRNGAGSSERMRIDSSGNVGIGASPTFTAAYGGLHVHSTYPEIHLTGTDSGSGAGDGFKIQKNSANHVYLWNYENAFMALGTNNAERMRIDSSGNVGIGVTPNSGWGTGTGSRQALQIGFGSIAGRLNDLNTEISNNAYAVTTGSNPTWAGMTRFSKQQIELDNSGNIKFNIAPTVDQSAFDSSPNFTWTEAMTLDSSGNVGIGVTPARQVHMHNASGDNNFHITNSTTGSTATDGFSIVSQSTTNDVLFNQRETANMRFFTANDEKMRIDSSGNVGIGTSSPASALELEGAGNATNITLDNTTASTGRSYSIRSGNTGKLDIYDNDATAARLVIDSSGNVGIGTSSPSQKLHVEGAGNQFILLNNSTTNDGFYFKAGAGASSIQTNAGSHVMNFFTGGSEAMRIDSSGNVGISTTLPSPDYGSDTVLEVKGSTSPGIVINDTGQASKYGIHADSNDLKITYGSGALVSFQNDGNVGIGTSDPHDAGANFSMLTLNGAKGGGIVFSDDDVNQHQIYTTDDASLRFARGSGLSDESMRIDSSGNLLVGMISANTNNDGVGLRADGLIHGKRADVVATFNRKTSDGTIVELAKDNAVVGSIGAVGGDIYVGTTDTNFRFADSLNAILPVGTAGATRDNAIDLGSSGNRFDDIFATNGTIQTSDRNEKQDIAELTDAEQRVAVACKGLLRKFRWKDAVAEKGDEARTHFGIIAQDLQAAFAAEGLDAGDYAMFISSTWTDEDTGEERTRMGVRYSELLAFIIAAI